MGLPLPDELIGLTFDHLDVLSLLKCTQVCKLFQSLVLGNTQLCYRIELFASCMEDNERSSMDTITRLNLLRQYSRGWNNLEWTSSGTIPMRDGNSWEFAGGVLAQSSHESEVFFVQLPCKRKGIGEKRWTTSFGFRFRDFTMDNSQNLIVLLETVGIFPVVSCKLHLRTLAGDHHPNATVAQITRAVVGLQADFSFLIQICGKRIAILCYDQLGGPSQSSFLVWNWQTGQEEVYIYTSAFRSYAFMTEDLVLAAILRPDGQITLRVLSIAALVNSVLSLEHMPYVCELQFPEFQGNIEHFLIRSDPTPTWRPPTCSNVPFYSSQEDFIFTISIRVLFDETQESMVLFIPLSTILLQVERSRNVPHCSVAWNAWGPGGTRMVSRELSDNWVCYAYGMKFVQGLRWKNGHVARVYDFNPYAARKHVKTRVESPIPWKPLAKQSKLSSRCESIEEEVATTLPGRVANITLLHSEEGWDAVMIGENHILMVQPQSSKYGYMTL